MKKKNWFIFGGVIVLLIVVLFLFGMEKTEKVRFETNMGNITIELYSGSQLQLEILKV